ncbi:unnamed protein product [Trichobilharzia regenti]|nr:unnamed protein product [Trichobilharzia regenti]
MILVTTISVNQGEIPEGVHPAEEPVGHFYLSQTFFFPQIRPKLIHQIPIWPIIVGVVLGLIVLYLLIILLYLLGFFRRRKTQLRKAMLTKGGAEETYKREQTESLLVGETKPEQTNDVAHKAMNSTPPGQGDAKMSPGKKLKKKHKKDLNILHPGDLSTVTTSSTNGHQHHAYKESEEQNLITDSTSSQ